MSDYELGVIGGGNMAEAMLRGVIAAGFLDRRRIVVADVDPSRRQNLSQELDLRTVEGLDAPAACRKILLAVKPQALAGVLGSLAGLVGPDTLVISIAAGVRTSVIANKLGPKVRVARVMPNTPMLAGAGMSAVCAGPGATPADLDWTCRLCAASGEACTVDESAMDAVTAVSGSGPAYFFYLVEAMVSAGLAEGLDQATARQLACQTCLGAGKLLMDSPDDPATLRAKVTSPNGTTQRAIETLDAAGVKDALVRAVRAAADRSRELGRAMG